MKNSSLRRKVRNDGSLQKKGLFMRKNARTHEPTPVRHSRSGGGNPQTQPLRSPVRGFPSGVSGLRSSFLFSARGGSASVRHVSSRIPVFPLRFQVSSFILLFSFYFLLSTFHFLPSASAQGVTNTWDFTNAASYSISEPADLEVDVTPPGQAQLILHAQHEHRTTYAEHTAGTNVSLRFGPPASLILKKTNPTHYQTAATFISRIMQAPSGNRWDYMSVKASNIDFIPDPDLIALYRMDDDAWLDAVTGNSGTPSGSPTFVTDAMVGTHAGFFRGPPYTDYTRLYNRYLIQSKSQITMACWMKLGSYTGFGGILSAESPDILQLSAGSKQLGFRLIDGGGTHWAYVSGIELDTWYFVVATWSRSGDGKMRTYKNGRLVDTGASTTYYQTQGDYMFIGSRPSKPSTYASDVIVDEVAIWDRALSSNEVYQLYVDYSRTYPLRFQVRAATNATLVTSAPFVGPDGTTNSYYFSASQKLVSTNDFDATDRFAQYKAYLYSSVDQTETPYLEAVGLVGTRGNDFDNTGYDFTQGTFGPNITNIPALNSRDFLGLGKNHNGGYYTNGGFESRVITNAGGSVSWDEIAWVVAGKEIDADLDADEIPGLIGYYKGGSGWADESLNGHSGNPSLGVDDTDLAKLGSKSGVFDEDQQAYVDAFGFTTIRALEFWIRNHSPSDAIVFLSDTGGSHYICLSNRMVTAVGYESTPPAIYVNGSGVSPKLASGWNHVAIVWDSDVAAEDFTVGKIGSDYMDGLIDEMAVYDRNLPSGEILKHFTEGWQQIAGKVRFQSRASDDPTFSGVNFVGPGGSETAYHVSAPDGLDCGDGQYFQYRVFLDGSGEATPGLISVSVLYDGFSKSFTDNSATDFYAGSIEDEKDNPLWYGDEVTLARLDALGPPNITAGDFLTGIEGVWHMDNTWDDSEGAGDGTPDGGVAFSGEAKIGSHCGAFDGVDGRVTLDNSSLGSSSFSAGLWMRSSDSTRCGLLSTYSGVGSPHFSIELNGNGVGDDVGRVTFTIDDGTGAKRAVSHRAGLNNGRWHHILGVRNLDQILLYVDGDLVGAEYIGTSYGDIGGASAEVGYSSDSGYFKGFIDEVVIFTGDLSPAEVGRASGAGYRTTLSAATYGTLSGVPIDAGRPAIWEEMGWTPDGPHGVPLDATADSLRGCWHLDETSGSAVDATGNGNNGTVSATQGVVGRFDKCVRFSGGGDQITVADSASLEPSSLTVEGWLYPDEIEPGVLFSKRSGGTGYELGTDASGRPYVWIGTAGGGVTNLALVPLRSDQWNHLAGTYDADSSEVVLYVNGEPVQAAASVTGSLGGGGATMGLGFTGGALIDEVAVHERALMGEEILDHYRSGAATLKFQGRAWDPAAKGQFVGPGESNTTYFTVWHGDDMIGDIPLGNYFEYRGYFGSETHRYPPVLWGLSIDDSSYPSENPTVEPIESKAIYFPGRLLSASHTVVPGPRTEVQYQISGDTGLTPTWYYWDTANGRWTNATTFGYSLETSPMTGGGSIASHIGSFYDQLYNELGGSLRFRGFLHSDGDYQIKLQQFKFTASRGRVVLTFPDGEEVGSRALVVGVPYDITWTWDGVVNDNIRIDLYNNSGSNFVATLGSGLANTGVYNTVISEDVGTTYRIRIRDMSDPTGSIEDWSDSNFQLIKDLHISSPDGGEFWSIWNTNTITWESWGQAGGGVGDLVSLWFSDDAGATWYEITTPAERPANQIGNNSYVWTTPTNDSRFVSEEARMGVSTPGALNPVTAFYGDISDTNFIMSGIVITFPNDSVNMGEPTTIEWRSAGAGSQGATIDLFDGVSWTNITTNATCLAGTNIYHTELNAPNPTQGARIRITANENPSVYGITPEFTLAEINIIAPRGGTPATRDRWEIGTTNQIMWTSGGAGTSVNIDYRTDSTSTWARLFSSVANTNSGAGSVVTNTSPLWIMPEPPSSNAQVRITSGALVSTTDPFDISGISLLFPNGGETWRFGRTNEVRWLYQAAGGNLDFEITYQNGVLPFVTLKSFVSIFDGRWTLDVSEVLRPASLAKLRIRSTQYSSMEDTSENTFTIRGLSMTYPTNNAVYTMRTTVSKGLRWYSAEAGATVASLFYSRDNFATSNRITFAGLPTTGNNDSGNNLNEKDWVIPGTLIPSTNGKVRVFVSSFSSTSYPFTLRGIRITRPAKGETLDIGTLEGVSWVAAGLKDSAFSSNALSIAGQGGTFEYVGVGDAGSDESFILNNGFNWNIDPELDPTTNAVIRMSIYKPAEDTDVVMYSDPFTLRGLKVLSPATGTNWQLGASETISFMAAGLGAGAEATVYYSANGGATYDTIHPITNEFVVTDGLNTFTWDIESSYELTRLPSTNAVVKVVVGAYEDASEPFRMSGIKVTKPRGSDIWAVSDGTNTIEWVSVDAVDNYDISFSLWQGGVPVYTEGIDTGVSGDFYDWNMTSNAIGSNVTITVTDGSFVGISEMFEIVSKPSIQIISPAPGDYWKVGGSNTIRWVRGGKMTNSFVIKTYIYPYGNSNVLVSGSFPIEDGIYSYQWKPIPNALGPAKLVISNTVNPNIRDDFSGFTIAPSFEFDEPFFYAGGDGNVFALANKTIRWTTLGSLTAGVDLYYSLDRSNPNNWIKINSTPFTEIAHEQPSDYEWNPIANARDDSVYFRVQDHNYTQMFDADDPGPYDDLGPFPIKYYQVVWNVYNTETLAHLDQLSVADSSGWSGSGLTSPVTNYYPYGVWDTVWYREFFGDEVVFHWTADSNQTRYVFMQKSAADPDYHVLSNFRYSFSEERFRIQSWLERGGAILDEAEQCTIRVYDQSGNVITNITNVSGDYTPFTGVFWQNWNVSGLGYPASEVFFARVEILYSGVTYSSGVTFQLMEPASAEVDALLQAMEDSSSNILASIGSVSGQVADVYGQGSIISGIVDRTARTVGSMDTNLLELLRQSGIMSTNIDLMSTNVLNMASGISNIVDTSVNLSNLLVDVYGPVTNLESRIGGVASNQVSDLARILTRPTTVVYGSDVNILYKTLRGYDPSVVRITVSNATQGVVDTGNMTEIVTGIYEEELTADWGTNSYIVVCSDPEASDSMVLSVVGEETKELVSPMFTSISNDLKTVESKVTNVLDIVKGIQGADLTGVTNTLDDLDKRITEINQAVQGIGNVGDVQLADEDLAALQRIETQLAGNNTQQLLNSIEQRLGSINDTASANTFFGRLSAIVSRLEGVGNIASDAASDAQLARTAAADAASGVQTLRTLIEEGNLEEAGKTLLEVQSSLAEAQKSIQEIPGAMGAETLGQTVRDIARNMEEFVATQGYKYTVPLEGAAEGEAAGAGATGGEAGAEATAVELLNKNIAEMQHSMKVIQVLLDEAAYEPQVIESYHGVEE